jgi:Tfp pilus assembly PilM family ATPase
MSALLQRLRAAGSNSKPRPSRVGSIGLHFAEEQAHAVQLRRLESGAYCLRAWSSQNYSESRESTLRDAERLQEFAGQLLGRGLFRGRKVVTALPPAATRIMSLNYQAVGGVSDAERILRTMSDRLEGSIEDYVVDYLPVRGEPGDRNKVAVVAASKRADVIAFLESMRQAGLEVIELEINPAALNRLVSLLPRPPESQGNVLIINYGNETSYLTLVSGRRLLMDKEIDFGSNMLIRQIAKGLDISTDMAAELAIRQGLTQAAKKPFGATAALIPEDLNPIFELVQPVFAKLTEEVRRACLYVSAESKGDVVERVYTFGSVSRWPGASRLLSDTARVPVADTLPINAILDGDQSEGVEYKGVGPDLAVATGLALRGLTDDA